MASPKCGPKRGPKCRKCGGGPLTRRRAGVFSCNHCGVQPGPMRLTRGGLPFGDARRKELA